MSELRHATWRAVKQLNDFTFVPSVCVAPLRVFVEPGIHVGNKDIQGEQMIEWYAGQLLSVVDREAWLAMNSILRCAEKFLGPK